MEQSITNQDSFNFKVVRLLAQYYCLEYLEIDDDSNGVSLWINLSDWFCYASAWATYIETEEDYQILKQSFEDCHKIGLMYVNHAPNLYACRKEKLPPLKEYLKPGKYQLPEKLLPLFKEDFTKWSLKV